MFFMNRIIGFVIFFSIFVFIYLGLHFYVFVRLANLFDIRINILFYTIMLAFASSFVLSSILVRFFTNIFTRIFYAISAAWLGVLFLLFCTLILYEISRLFMKLDPKTAGIIILIIVLILSSIGIINFFFVKINTVNISFAEKDVKKDIKIVQLSDVHVGTIRNSEYLTKIVQKVNEQKPDLVLITGDLVDGSGPISDEMFAPLKDIKAPTYFTAGNHEFYEGINESTNLISKTGIIVLRDQVVEVKGIQLIGVDYSTKERSYLKEILPTLKLNKSKPTILMYHTPTELKEANKARVDLQLSGHTHFGQVFPFTIFVKMVYPNIKGLYQYNQTYLYVSQGTGTWGPPMRLGSSNEITVINILKSK